LESRERMLLYLGAWIPGSGLLAALVTASSGMPWHQSVSLALPMGLVYAFVCLAAWYPCQAMPLGGSTLVQPLAAHGFAALLSSTIWVVAGIGWSEALDRTRPYADTREHYMDMLVLFVVVGVLLYGLAVAVHYLLIAFETSREAESRNLELRVQTQEAELRAVEARREQELAERELELARSIQRRLLPPAHLDGDGYEVAARNLPARFVAGDFYDVFRLDRGRIGLVVADVAGKGIGASLITASVKAMTPLIAANHSVTETLIRLNEKLCGELTAREFVALSIALFDTRTGEVEVANSGLPDPYVLAPGRGPEVVEVPGPRLPLGIRQDVRYQSRTIRLEPGARILLLTDGIPEARLESGEPLGYEALCDMLAHTDSPDGPSAWLDDIFEQVRRVSDDGPHDDLTALVLERRAGSAVSVSIDAVVG
ncbi:MAG: PP2C family protein-serine/threonine phosphatase, partial [Thermoanaerobaculia bacterium]|nr:PP2C family protein-serine/threonine phosphatase [Thermoanaerobaculia bacterium]